MYTPLYVLVFLEQLRLYLQLLRTVETQQTFPSSFSSFSYMTHMTAQSVKAFSVGSMSVVRFLLEASWLLDLFMKMYVNCRIKFIIFNEVLVKTNAVAIYTYCLVSELNCFYSVDTRKWRIKGYVHMIDTSLWWSWLKLKGRWRVSWLVIGREVFMRFRSSNDNFTVRTIYCFTDQSKFLPS